MKAGFWGAHAQEGPSALFTQKCNKKAHKARLSNTTKTIDTRPHESAFPHLNLKKQQLMEDRYNEIETGNKLLLSRMTKILKEPRLTPLPLGRGDAFEKGTITSPGKRLGPVSLNSRSRKKEMDRINNENNRLLERIKKEKGMYNRETWLKERKQQLKYLNLHKNRKYGLTDTPRLSPIKSASSPLLPFPLPSTTSSSVNFELPYELSKALGLPSYHSPAAQNPPINYIVDEEDGIFFIDNIKCNVKVFSRDKKLFFIAAATSGGNKDKREFSTHLNANDVKLLLSEKLELFTTSKRKDLCLALISFLHFVDNNGKLSLAFGKISNISSEENINLEIEKKEFQEGKDDNEAIVTLPSSLLTELSRELNRKNIVSAITPREEEAEEDIIKEKDIYKTNKAITPRSEGEDDFEEEKSKESGLVIKPRDSLTDAEVILVDKLQAITPREEEEDFENQLKEELISVDPNKDKKEMENKEQKTDYKLLREASFNFVNNVISNSLSNTVVVKKEKEFTSSLLSLTLSKTSSDFVKQLLSKYFSDVLDTNNNNSKRKADNNQTKIINKIKNNEVVVKEMAESIVKNLLLKEIQKLCK